MGHTALSAPEMTQKQDTEHTHAITVHLSIEGFNRI